MLDTGWNSIEEGQTSLEEYLKWFDEWILLYEASRDEIKFVLSECIKSWRLLWILPIQRLIETLELVNEKHIFDFWVIDYLIEYWLLDRVYKDCILSYEYFEQQLFKNRYLNRELKNNLKLLDKCPENIRIKILKILDME